MKRIVDIIHSILNEDFPNFDAKSEPKNKNKTLHSGDINLRDMTVEDVKDNIVVFRQGEKGGFIEYGYTLVYFCKDEETAKKLASGELGLLRVPRGTFNSGGNPITDVWKKKYSKPGMEGILGLIEGHSDDDIVYIDMISVRPGYRRNTIATKMLQRMRSRYPNAKIKHSDTTDDGGKFMKGVGV